MKVCGKCNETKPFDAFHRDKRRPDGRSAICRDCYSTYHREWLVRNRDKKKSQIRSWYAKRAESAPPPPEVTKACRQCGIVKPLVQFHANAATPDRRSNRCATCITAYLRQRRTDDETRIRDLASALDWRKRNADRLRDILRAYGPRKQERSRQRRAANPDAAYEMRRHSQLRQAYGIGLEDYAAMLTAQDGVCMICGESGGIRQLSVDHDHETGRIRALLCGSCNTGLGNFRENPELLRSAAAYIEAFRDSADTEATA